MASCYLANVAARSINRFELKYLVEPQTAAALRATLRSRMSVDPLGDDGSYPVWSCYYDTADLRAYWEKIDGQRFRRKLRIRHYGSPATVDADTQVWVEIKARINRVTQKRRERMRYADALELCAGRPPGSVDERFRPFVDEVTRLSGELDLRPVAVVGYVREAYMGGDDDAGLRVTFDSRVRARDRELLLSSTHENRLIVRPDLSIMEVKVNDRAPFWFVNLIASHNLDLVRISKYCQAIDAFGGAPRSVFHVPSDHETELAS